MKKRLSKIAEFVGSDTILRINRKPIDPYELDGLLVGISKNLLLLHVIDGNTLLLNGYSAVRLSDIRSFRVDKTFVGRALRLLDRQPSIPVGIDLSSWATLLPSLQQHYPLLMIETEKKEPGCAFIGRVAKQTARSVKLEKVNTKGEWDETKSFPFKDITKVKFEDGYTSTLAHLVSHESALL